MEQALSPAYIVEATQPPALVYKAPLTPTLHQAMTALTLMVKLSEAATRALVTAAAKSMGLSLVVSCVVRRFDLADIEVAVGPVGAQTVVTITTPPEACKYSLDITTGVLTIDVKRTCLPVTNRCGNASFVLVVHMPCVMEDVLVSRPFRVASKQPKRTVLFGPEEAGVPNSVSDTIIKKRKPVVDSAVRQRQAQSCEQAIEAARALKRLRTSAVTGVTALEYEKSWTVAFASSVGCCEGEGEG